MQRGNRRNRGVYYERIGEVGRGGPVRIGESLPCLPKLIFDFLGAGSSGIRPPFPNDVRHERVVSFPALLERRSGHHVNLDNRTELKHEIVGDIPEFVRRRAPINRIRNNGEKIDIAFEFHCLTANSRTEQKKPHDAPDILLARDERTPPRRREGRS